MTTLPDLPATEAAIIEQTNQFRAEQKLAPVKPNATLARAAKAYAEFLARSGKFAHEADGREPADRAKAAGYRFCIIAENLALNLDSRGFETKVLATGAVEGWKNSPPHRAAMLQPHVTEIGVGIAKAPTGDPKFLSVQLFGRPESLKYSFRIENHAGADVRYNFAEKGQSLPKQALVTHTACLPSEVTVENAEPKARFMAKDGAVFSVRRDSGGVLRVEMSQGRPTSDP